MASTLRGWNQSFYCSYLGPIFYLTSEKVWKKSSPNWTKFLSTYTSALSQKRRVLLAMIPLVLKTTWAQKVHFLLPPLALCRRSTMNSNQLWSRIILFLYLFAKKVLNFQFLFRITYPNMKCWELEHTYLDINPQSIL